MMRLGTMKECSLRLLGLLTLISLSGCTLSNSGPSRSEILDSSNTRRIEGIQVVDVNDKVVRKLVERSERTQLAGRRLR